MSVMLKGACAYRSVTNVSGDYSHLKVTCMCTLEYTCARNVCEKPSKHIFNHKANLYVHTAEWIRKTN